MNAYPKIPRAWWRKIGEEYAARMSGAKPAKKYGAAIPARDLSPSPYMYAGAPGGKDASHLVAESFVAVRRC